MLCGHSVSCSSKSFTIIPLVFSLFALKSLSFHHNQSVTVITALLGVKTKLHSRSSGQKNGHNPFNTVKLIYLTIRYFSFTVKTLPHIGKFPICYVKFFFSSSKKLKTLGLSIILLHHQIFSFKLKTKNLKLLSLFRS